MNIMVDLETLGTVPGCAILSIGAVTFSTKDGTLGEEFYTTVHRSSCANAGLHEDASTLAWWNSQGAEARVVLAAADSPESPPLLEALGEFNRWLLRVSGGDIKGVYVWGNGADFDNPILACAYKATGLKQGWPSYNGRCYRSLKNLHPLFGLGQAPKMERGGTHHNALDDAKSQALHAIAIVADLRSRVHGLEQLGDESQ